MELYDQNDSLFELDNINDIPDMFNEAKFVIKKVTQSTTSNGSSYIRYNLLDSNGNDVVANQWNTEYKQDLINTINNSLIGALIEGKIDMYKGRKQINILDIHLTKLTNPNDNSNNSTQLTSDSSELVNELFDYIGSIDNEDYKKIIKDLMKDENNRRKFLNYPAATENHHSFNCGLMYHTLSIIRGANNIFNQYNNDVKIDKSLLFAGAFLHDFGKTIELGYDSDEGRYYYSDAGNLLGHISIVDGIIIDKCNKLGIDYKSEEITLLRHMILSHHGKLEYGSPITPRLIEAEILNRLDDLDATMNEINKSFKAAEDDSFGDKIFAKNNKSYFKH